VNEIFQTILHGAHGCACLCALLTALCILLSGCTEQKPTIKHPTEAQSAVARSITAAALSAPGSNVTTTATLAFDASSSSNVAGYRLYWGISPGTYTNSVSVGKTNLTITVNNLVQGRKYYFAATAFDAIGIESDFSNETFFPQPVTNFVTPFVESSGAVNGPWTNYWNTTLTNPPGRSQFFRFGIRATNSGAVLRLATGQLQVINTNQP
jgi:hypothetical protein